MPKREVVQSIVMMRDGKRETLSPGRVFDFTDEELADIMAANPNALSRKTVVDLDSADGVDLSKVETELADNQKSPPEGASKPAGPRGKRAAADL